VSKTSELAHLFRALKAPAAARALPALAERAREEAWSYERFAEILLAGGTSRVTGLAAELERLTRVRVRLADPLVRVDSEDGLSERDDLGSLAIAIGLGVED